MGQVFKHFKASQVFWPIVALVMFLCTNLFFNKNFFNIQVKDGPPFGSLIDILNRASPLMLLAIGMTFVLIIGGIDISIGSVIAFTCMLSANLIQNKHLSPSVVIPLVLLIGAAVGFGMGYLIQVYK